MLSFGSWEGISVAQKKSLMDSIPVLLLIGILAGAVGGLGVGVITFLKSQPSSSSSTAGK
jgi:hypothetical protein